ncbi:hypothetical protein ONZ45_g13557 [Pleurotus djamor]|nr:hypothetical protein ONZ45_g13557 [Pleurotus djamor]
MNSHHQAGPSSFLDSSSIQDPQPFILVLQPQEVHCLLSFLESNTSTTPPASLTQLRTKLRSFADASLPLQNRSLLSPILPTPRATPELSTLLENKVSLKEAGSPKDVASSNDVASPEDVASPDDVASPKDAKADSGDREESYDTDYEGDRQTPSTSREPSYERDFEGEDNLGDAPEQGEATDGDGQEGDEGREGNGGDDGDGDGHGEGGETEEDEDEEEDEVEDNDAGNLLQAQGQRKKQKKKTRCSRGSRTWKPALSTLPGQPSIAARSIIAKVMAVSKHSQPLDATNWAYSVSNFLSSTTSPISSNFLSTTQSVSTADGDSIPGIIWQIKKADANRIGESFLTMLNLIRLVVKTEVIRARLEAEKDTQNEIPKTRKRKRRAAVTIQDILKNLREDAKVPFSIKNNTFQGMVNKGRKYASLAASGSVYILWIIAGTQSAFSAGDLLDQDIKELCLMLQSPVSGDFIIQTLIPLLSETRARHPAVLYNIFDQEFLREGESAHLDCTNLEATETVLDRLKRNEFHLPPRNKTIWASFQVPLAVPTHSIVDIYSANARALGFENVTPAPEAFTEAQKTFLDGLSQANHATFLSSAYDFSAPANNKKVNADWSKKCQATKLERKSASKAETIRNLDHLATRLHSFYPSGVKIDSQYMYLPFESIQPSSNPLLVKCEGGELLFLRGTLPEYLKTELLPKITAIFGELHHRTSEDDSRHWSWSSIHFDYYNRYSTHGDEAPLEVNPKLLTKEGKKRAHSSQFIPRPSTEMKLFPHEYATLQDLFADVFEELRSEIERLLPQEYHVEKLFAELLPGEAPSPVFPFSGVVVNLNVETALHFDYEDVVMCLVLAIGDFMGGDLCFRDSGIRLEVRNGDWVVFNSRKEAHFNMPYEGRRASLVLHSDKAGEYWVEDRNGWQENDFMG